MMTDHSHRRGANLIDIGTVEMGVFQEFVGLLWRHMLKERWTVEYSFFVVRRPHTAFGHLYKFCHPVMTVNIPRDR